MTLTITRRMSLALAAGLAVLALTSPARAEARFVDYSAASLAELAASGQPYLIDFYASWCTTCAAQERVLHGLAEANPAYAAIPVLRVDWDRHSRGDLVRQMGIPRRSTLVMMVGTTELGRLVAETGREAIASLLDLAGS
jgi:thiol-disulfide isomerase/thioredoxin